VSGLIVHIAREVDWHEAKRAGEYAPSTLSRDGFIHLSRPEQVHLPANAVFSGQRDLVLLWVDTTGLRAELRYEAPEPGAPRFPAPLRRVESGRCRLRDSPGAVGARGFHAAGSTTGDRLSYWRGVSFIPSRIGPNRPAANKG
jgi:uncharacterized protein (DUF952 family)